MDDAMPQTESQEIHLQERAIQTLADDSLPAAQVITEHKDEAEQIHAPRFIP